MCGLRVGCVGCVRYGGCGSCARMCCHACAVYVVHVCRHACLTSACKPTLTHRCQMNMHTEARAACSCLALPPPLGAIAAWRPHGDCTLRPESGVQRHQDPLGAKAAALGALITLQVRPTGTQRCSVRSAQPGTVPIPHHGAAPPRPESHTGWLLFRASSHAQPPTYTQRMERGPIRWGPTRLQASRKSKSLV